MGEHFQTQCPCSHSLLLLIFNLFRQLQPNQMLRYHKSMPRHHEKLVEEKKSYIVSLP